MLEEILSETEANMAKAIERFKSELAKVRTGRANISLLDNIRIDYYGTPTPLNQVANVTVADARMITIKPWEKPMLPLIEKAIRTSDLGLNPVSDAELVRLPIPPLTHERRKELAKVIKKMTEEARIAVRSGRRDANDMLKDAEKEKELSEDESQAGQKRIQAVTDKFILIVDEVGSNKEAEILEV